MTLSLTMGTRRWDHLLPITLGEVTIPGVTVRHQRGSLTPTPAERAGLQVAEQSLSQMLLNVDVDTEWMPLPAFPLAAFRHRCIVVLKGSDRTDLADLAGATVGATGWADTGNVWTKSLLLDAGVDLASIRWRVGALESGEPHRPRLTGHDTTRMTADVSELPGGQCLRDELLAGRLDAVLTPTMPTGFHEPDSPFRMLLAHFRSAEEAYFARHRFVPAIHVLTIRASLVQQQPWLASAVVELCDRAWSAWQAERTSLVDTTPWLIDEITAIARTMGSSWSPYRFDERLDAMIDTLVGSYEQQGVGPLPANAEKIFDRYRLLDRTPPSSPAGGR